MDFDKHNEDARKALHNLRCKQWRDKRTPEQKAKYRAQQREYQRKLYHTSESYREISKRSKREKRLNRTEDDWIKEWLYRKRNECKKTNREFSLDLDWVNTKLESGRCEVTGIEFVIPANTDIGSKIGPFTPSFDRKICSEGYTKENTRVVIWALNAAVGTWGDQILERVSVAYLMSLGYSITKKDSSNAER